MTTAAWRRRLLDQVCAVGALIVGGLVLLGLGEIGFGTLPLRDTLVVVCPLALMAAALFRGAPFGLRTFLLLASLFCIQFLGASQFGFTLGTALIGLLAVGLTGLLLGVRWAIAGWAVSTGVLLAAGLLIHAGWLPVSFDPARVDPRDLQVAVRFSLSYGGFSALLAVGVYAVVERLTSSLNETRQALAEVISAKSERARAEVDKRAAEAQFRSLVEHAPDSIAIVDREHRVLFANHETFDPNARSSPVGFTAEDLVAPEFAERVRAGVEHVFEKGEPVGYDILVPVEGRGQVWYSSRVGPIVEDGRVDRVIVVSTDISTRRSLEEQLLQAQKLEAVGQLTGGVAHDFNNLLTVILGNLQLVSSGLDAGDPARGFVENARAAARRGSALTHRLLAFGRKQALQPRVIDLGRLVAGMDDLLRRTLGETIVVETGSAPGLWKCEIDPIQLENVVLNLAINARDAMPQGGRIEIETSNASLGDEVERVPPGEYVMLSLRDEGSGMGPEVLAHAFEPFFTTKGLGRGSGLGLSMVYGFVKQSGGHVAIDSAPGEGTRVRVYLPRVISASEASGAATAGADRADRLDGADALAGRGELILVVEDDAAVRSLTVNLLESGGYKTVEAGDALAALALLEREQDIALVFTDVVLPGDMSGVDLARHVRAERPELPLLFTSGYLEKTMDARLVPGVALVEKPFTPELLAERVRAALNLSDAGC